MMQSAADSRMKTFFMSNIFLPFDTVRALTAVMFKDLQDVSVLGRGVWRTALPSAIGSFMPLCWDRC